MSYTYLQEQGAESSAATFSDIPAFVLSRLNLTAGRSCSSGNATGACPGSQSGMTFAPSTGDRGGDSLTLCAAGSHARTFPQQDAASASPASDRDSGRKWPASLAKWDRDTCLWRTHQFSLQGDLEPFSATWPRWGLMRGGECWERTMPGHLTSASGSGFWLTPTAQDRGTDAPNRMGGPSLGVVARRFPTPQASDSRDRGNLSMPSIQRRQDLGKQLNLSMVVSEDGGALNPPWVEWLMGFPIGWTDLRPLAMDKFQQWRHSHGGHSANEQAKSGGGQ